MRSKLWTRSFTLICLATFACYSSNYLVVPVLPLYVQDAGGSLFFAGLIFGAFSVTSFLVRPLFGKLTDSWSIGGVLLCGSLILSLGGLAFLVPALWVALLVNGTRGVGWAAINTASATAIAVTSPPTRRAEASGSYSVASTIAVAVAPALSLWFYGATGGLEWSFVGAGLAGLAAAGVVRFLPPLGAEAVRGRGPFTLRGSGFSFDTFIDRRVLLASLLLLSVTTTTPVVIAFIPVHALGIGVDNIGIFFLANGAVAILSRVTLAGYLDRGPRGMWIALGLALGAVAFVLLSMATSLGWFIAAGIINSIGLSLSQTSLMAVAMDRADPAHMGRAMATYSMFFRAGEGIGAPLAGALIERLGFSGMYYGALLSVSLGLLATAVNWRALSGPRQTRA